MCEPIDPVSFRCNPNPIRNDAMGNPVCGTGRPANRPDPNPPAPAGRGWFCNKPSDCGYAFSRRRLGDDDPYNAQVPDEFRPECRVFSGPNAGTIVNCIDQDNRTPGGQIACANMDTDDNNDNECVYCPPNADGSPLECASMLPDDPDFSGGDGPMALSAFRMRTRMSMARFH